MTAPTPEQMRALADAADELYREGLYGSTIIDDVVVALRTAADEVDRLRLELAECDPPAVPVIEAMGDAIREITRLHAVLKNAPHGDGCQWPHPDDAPEAYGNYCDCWKADAR